MNDAARPAPSPDRLVQGLVDLLDVEEIDTDLYRGARRPGGQGRVCHITRQELHARAVLRQTPNQAVVMKAAISNDTAAVRPARSPIGSIRIARRGWSWSMADRTT